ncbi:MAG: site-specific DNA-methyltransferase [bacterium]|nr:MAG: site-specific DNA-methyltransferase [bacterium]
MRIISLFSGIGGLDIGFVDAGFEIIWANDYDKNAMTNYCENIKIDSFDNRKFEHIPFCQIPDSVDGIIAGMPGSGWTISGNLSGIRNRKGQYIFDFIRLVKNKKPKFFLIEMLPGFLFKYNRQPNLFILELLTELGYSICQKKLNAKDYGIPQDRNRVFILGIINSYQKDFNFPQRIRKTVSIKDSIYDLKDNALKAVNGNEPNQYSSTIKNHEFIEGNYSPLFMSRNRVRGWNDVSYTIQADRRLIPIHPNAPKMLKLDENHYIFNPLHNGKYRRFTIRECARLQSFRDSYILKYDTLDIGYHLVGNATPPLLSYSIAKQLFTYFQ